MRRTVGTAVFGPERTVVWEDGERKLPSYPIGHRLRDFLHLKRGSVLARLGWHEGDSQHLV